MNGYMKKVENDRQTTINHNFVTGHEYEFVVRAVGPDGTEEAIEHAVRDVVNIVGEQFPPDVPTVLTATGFLLSITLAWTNPSNYDMDKMEIWRAVSNEVNAAVKIAEVRGTSYVDSIGESDITRYYWIKAVDTSGNISGFYPSTPMGVSATTTGVVATDIDDFSITATKMFNKTIILSADAWTNNSPGAGSVAWNAHSVVYNGVSYPIDAGNTASAYIYWTIGDTAYSAAATHPSLGTTAFMVAINTTGIHTLVWNSSANMVIGTAFIANLAVTNAKINDLSASKLTAGTIDASVITVTNINASNISTGTLLARTIRTATSGARFDIMYPDIGTIRAIDDVGGVVFEIYIAGADVGDVTIGDFAGDKGCRWDKSAGTFTVRGILNADDLVAGAIDASVINVTNLDATNITTGTLTGRTVQTASSGQRVILDGTENRIDVIEAAGTNVVIRIDDDFAGVSTNPGMLIASADGAYLRLSNDAGVGTPSPTQYVLIQDTGINVTNAINSGSVANIFSERSGNWSSGNGIGIASKYSGSDTDFALFQGINGAVSVFEVLNTGQLKAFNIQLVDTNAEIAAHDGSSYQNLLLDGATIVFQIANTTKMTLSAAGRLNVVGGFEDNGTAGVDGTFIDNSGNTITVSGGIITALT